jgi:uncharacterized protein (DUF1778 family)
MPSPTGSCQRDQRLEARVTAEQKELLEPAASLQGRTVTDFVVSSPQDTARQTIADHAVWRLTEEQRNVFLEALMNPSAPNAKLREAYKRFRKYKAPAGR